MTIFVYKWQLSSPHRTDRVECNTLQHTASTHCNFTRATLCNTLGGPWPTGCRFWQWQVSFRKFALYSCQWTTFTTKTYCDTIRHPASPSLILSLGIWQGLIHIHITIHIYTYSWMRSEEMGQARDTRIHAMLNALNSTSLTGSFCDIETAVWNATFVHCASKYCWQRFGHFLYAGRRTNFWDTKSSDFPGKIFRERNYCPRTAFSGSNSCSILSHPVMS